MAKRNPVSTPPDLVQQDPDSGQLLTQAIAAASRAEDSLRASAHVRILADAPCWIRTPTGTDVPRQWYREQIVANDPDVLAELKTNGVYLEHLE